MPSHRIAASLALILLLSSCRSSSSPDRIQHEPLVVMSYNIRYGTADDGENRWEARRDMLLDLIRRQNPDLLGLQEALHFQIEEIVAALPRYGVIGVGRDDGERAGEYSAILFRKDRFNVTSSGTFWFSDTPSVPGSMSWGNRYPRICTWARMIDGNGDAFWMYNVHLDHESQPSRERSVATLQQTIRERPQPAEPVIVTGDFNAGEENPAMRLLLRQASTSATPFADTFRVVYPTEAVVGTFNGFLFGSVAGEKIDYVLVSPGTEVLRAEIDRTSRSERYPSDHFPVVAEILLPRPRR